MASHREILLDESDATASNVDWHVKLPVIERKDAWISTTHSSRNHSGTASTSGRREGSLQNREWTQYHLVLKQKHNALEKSLFMPEAIRDRKALAEQKAVEHAQTMQLAKEMRIKVQDIQSKVQAIKEKLACVQPGQEYVRELAAAMDEGESAITDLKEEQRVAFEELMKQDRLYTRDLELMVEHMEFSAWETAVDAPPRPTSHSHPPSFQQAGSGLLPEVLEFEAFLEAHGETGGWEAEDHAEFERVRKACKGDYSHTVLVCCDQMIGFRKADIIAHARWHAEHVDLLCQKKLAIQEWRARRDAERAMLHAAADPVPPSAHAAAREREDLETETRLWREYQKQALGDWKAARQEEEREAAQKVQREREARQQAKAAEKAARQAHNKDRLEAYRASKVAERAAVERAAAAAEAAMAVATPRVTPEAARRLEERNAALLQRRLSQQGAKERDLREQSERLEKMRLQAAGPIESKVERDPSRLLKATASVAARQKAQEEDGVAPKDSGFIRSLPHRAIPSWRQPLRGLQ